jgi:2-keto-4-pentenoate hydratase
MIACVTASGRPEAPGSADQKRRRAAQALWDAWRSGRPLDALDPGLRPVDVAEGYAIQRALDELAGPPVGWKIAATSEAGQAHLGASGPMVGRLYERQRRPPGSALSVSGMRMRSAEPEFAFVIARDVEGPGGLEVQDVLAAVGSLVLAIEVPDSRFVDFAQVGVPSLIADAMCGGHFIAGPSVERWRSLELAEQPARMLCDDEERSRGRGANVLGDPRAALTWMTKEVLRRGWSLRSGEIVLTGASAPPIPVREGDALEAVFDGLGAVTVRFVQ